MCKNGLIMLAVILSLQLSSAVSVPKLLQNYESHVNMSLLIERQDKERVNTWSEEFQVRLVDVTAGHRAQVSNHQQHSFEQHKDNFEWTQCLNLYQNETTRAEQLYYVRENECLKVASSADEEKRQVITQVGREIRKWRRSYRYLMNKCRNEHPRSKEKAGICLVNYLEKDNYGLTFERLISMRSQAVGNLHDAFKGSLKNLDLCLDDQFSKYLEQIRHVMDVLNRCYSDKVICR